MEDKISRGTLPCASRGNGGQDIFYTDVDRTLFINLLEELVQRFNITTPIATLLAV